MCLNYIDKKDPFEKLTLNERKLLARVYGAGIASSIISWIEGEYLFPEHEFVMNLVTFFNDFPLDAKNYKGHGYA